MKRSIETLEASSLRRLLETDATARAAAVETLRSADAAQIARDGGRFFSFDEYAEFTDAVMSDRHTVSEIVFKKSKALGMPVSEQVKRKTFEAACVDRFHHSDGSTDEDKVRVVNDARYTADDGSRWYNYVGSADSIAHVVAYLGEELDVAQDKTRIGLGTFLQVNFA